MRASLLHKRKFAVTVRILAASGISHITGAEEGGPGFSPSINVT
jgi:hypothetical protein